MKNALRIACLDPRAEARGLRHGMGLADARGAVPDVVVDEADEGADRAFLEAIADWCDRYTPLVALDPPQGLFLDISGCAHLFASRGGNGEDGEAALLADLLGRLAAQGLEARAAAAATAGAAWALSRYGGGGRIAAGEEAAALAGLPVAALRISSDRVALLDRLGLKRIGQLIGRPRAPLAARFGMELVTRLDQALGIDGETLSPRRPAPAFSAERRFAEPISEEASVLETVRSLAGSLAPALERHGLGARRIELGLYRLDGHVARTTIGTASPLRRPDRVARLFAERLAALGDALDAGFGFDMVRLAVIDARPMDPAQIDLAGEAEGSDDLDRLVDQIGARLGTASVTRLLPVDTHIPERATAARPFAALGAAALPAWAVPHEEEAPPERPLRLLVRPEPVEVMAEIPEGPPLRFRWRRAIHEVARSEGPERIAPEWWNRADAGRATRDYFRVEDGEGRRYWLFREGLYGSEGERPRWYLHGLFA